MGRHNSTFRSLAESICQYPLLPNPWLCPNEVTLFPFDDVVIHFMDEQSGLRESGDANVRQWRRLAEGTTRIETESTRVWALEIQV